MLQQCSNSSNSNDNRKPLILAAGSLMVPFTEMGERFEALHPDVKVIIAGHGSIQVCRHTVDLGDPASLVAISDYPLLPLLVYTKNVTDTDTPYADLMGITVIDASGRNISNLSVLEHGTGFIELYLNRNSIQNIETFSVLKQRKKINPSQDPITNISTIVDLTNLEWLSLGKNMVSDITPLGNMVNLKNLILNVNQIHDISALSGLNKLQTLHLHINLVKDISVLAKLNSLSDVGVMGNKISNTEPLVINDGLNAGDCIDLCGNLLYVISLETCLPQL